MPKDTIKQPTDIDRYVGMRVRAARRELKLTQDALGKMLDITFQQVQKYERGVNRISSGKLYEIANVLKRPLEYFYPEQIGDVDEDDARAEALVRSDLRKDCKSLIDELDRIEDLEAIHHMLTLARSAPEND
ncbi:MAG: helix-turn-helix transcriptional regulator [Pseudomonadota bacterium]